MITTYDEHVKRNPDSKMTEEEFDTALDEALRYESLQMRYPDARI